MSTARFATVADVADAFVRWLERLDARVPAIGRPMVAMHIAAWAEMYSAPDLLAAIRRVRPELVEDVGTSVELTKRPWVAEVAQALAGISALGLVALSPSWRCQLRVERPKLARQLVYAEEAVDRHIAALAELASMQRTPAVADRIDEAKVELVAAALRYKQALVAVTSWVDKHARCS
jgi:hypothetical protein